MPMQDSLPAGWLTFAERELNPLGRDERFPSCYISSPFPGFILTRREFIALVSGAVVWPIAGRAQQPARTPRIGYLGLGTAADISDRVEALRAGLRDLGYVEGTNIALEFRFTESIERLREHAAELVGSNVDVIFATSSTEVEVVRQETKTIPIVFATHFDPVGVGHVASLARPGGNITGLGGGLLPETAGKAVAMLKEVVPHMKKIGVLWSPNAPHQPILQAIEIAGAKLGVQVQLAPVRTVEEFESAFATMAQERVDAIYIVPSSLTLRGRDAPRLLGELALKHRLPSSFGSKVSVVAGGLMSYSPDWIELTRQAATYIDKILKGAKPADLAVAQATKFEFVINLQTAKALGITIPPTLLASATEIIE